MSYPTEKFLNTAFSDHATSHSVRLREIVEERQKIEIGERIRELREMSPHTNRSIADAVGVSERAVGKWIQGKGISGDHLEAVAELFEVEPNWLWRGDTPDLLGRVRNLEQSVDRLSSLEASVAEIHDLLTDQALAGAEAEAAEVERRNQADRRSGGAKGRGQAKRRRRRSA